MRYFTNVPPGFKTISDMAATYNVSLRTLRFYEDKELLAPLRMGGARLYSPKDEIRLQLILKGKRFGFSLMEIEQLIVGKQAEASEAADLELPKEIISDQIEILERKRGAVAAAIDELKLALAG